MDILKHKFKKGILKFYQNQHDFQKCHEIFEEIFKDEVNQIEYCYAFADYDQKVIGFHFNLIFKSRSYRNLREKYTNKGKNKDPRVYLWMHDIDSTDQFIDFVSYAKMRQECNFRRAMPHNINVPELEAPPEVGASSPQVTF